MNRFLLGVSIVILLVALAGCGLGETPDGGARLFLNAQMSGNQSQLLERTCTRLHGQIAAMQNLANLFGGSVPSSQNVDLTQLTFSTTGQSGSSAFVRISGSMRFQDGSTWPYDLTLPMLYEDNRWKACG